MRNNVFSLVSDVPVFNDQRTQGGEGTVEFAINHHWKLNANATGMHASLTNNPSNPAATGQRPSEFLIESSTCGPATISHWDAAKPITLGGGFTNRSSMFADLLNTNSIPSYTTADVVANINIHRWAGALGVRNLTDARYFTAANGVGGFVGDARSYFGKLQFQFGGKR